MNQTNVERDNAKPIIIFSAAQDTKSESENNQGHEYSIEQLKEHGISFKEVQEVYTYDNGQRGKERSLLVELHGKDDEKLVRALCSTFNQECYLYADDTRQGYLMTNDGTLKQTLGTLKAITEKQAETEDNYTYCPHLEQYFIFE